MHDLPRMCMRCRLPQTQESGCDHIFTVFLKGPVVFELQIIVPEKLVPAMGCLQTRCAPPPSLTSAGAEALRGGFAALPGVPSPASATRMRRPGVARLVRSFAGLSCCAPVAGPSAKKDCLARSLAIPAPSTDEQLAKDKLLCSRWQPDSATGRVRPVDQATLLLLSKTALTALGQVRRRSLWFSVVPGSVEEVELSNSLFVLEAL